MPVDYKTRVSVKDRIETSARIRAKFPSKCPVIVERAKHDTLVQDIARQRFLVNPDVPYGQLIVLLRSYIKELKPETAIFTFVAGRHLVPNSRLMKEVYREHHDPEDQMLYIVYSGESTFGR